jgi:phosphoribosylglycinamide formyltransferase 1
MPQTARLVALVSGTGSNLAALLEACAKPAYGAHVVAVGADRDGIRALDIAAAAGIPTFIVAPRDYADRSAWDAALAKAIDEYLPDYVISAGFMRLLGSAVLERFTGRVINTHPALLPAFPGTHGVRDALAYGVKVTGCTLHVVDAGVDTGPIIAQAVVTVEPDDDEATLHERIKTVERRLLVDWVGRIARAGMTVNGRKVSVP